ncbi:polyprenyl synthetase family protein [Anaplasma phagocytophilum]|uniref:Geranyltranstransferase n=1 Tax=Anaplasma phagocytophilum TaxID=948 RepID=A0A098EFE8_ANAPH|nr:polyprenyl synthetase family protein [Anaplasma phagocytophilum]CEG20527.1 Geranyltranstransferase [Anaplasma phagocytophilum]
MGEDYVMMRCHIKERVKDFSNLVGKELTKLIETQVTGGPAAGLVNAIGYCILPPGKCLRAFLASSVAQTFGASIERTLPLCLAIEVLHSYSLVHDDLPSMDNAPTRRGKNSCHIKHGEALALLTGDALLTLTFELLSSMDESCTVKCAIIRVISDACGHRGMVAGQALDMGNLEPSLEAVKQIHKLKTARLFSAACESGAILAEVSTDNQQALASYGETLGCAFQAKDDLCDINEDDSCLNIARILGREKTLEYIDYLLHQSEEYLERIDEDTAVLKELVAFIRNL